MSDFIIDPITISQDGIKSQIQAWLDAQPDSAAWSPFYASTTGQAFIDLTSGMMAFLKYDSMMARREAYLQFAQNRGSVIAGGQFMGYDAFRGRNAILSVTFTPATSGALALWDSIGMVKSLDMLVLTPTAYTIGVPVTVSVLLGNIVTQTLLAPNANLNVFRFTTPGVSNDLRMFIDAIEVQTSNNITDLLDGSFAVQTNPIGSIDAKYLNFSTFATKYVAGSQVQLDWVELNNLSFVLSDVSVDPLLGLIDTASITSFYQSVEATTSIQVNAPLDNETKNAVRGRNDMQKIYQKLNSTFIDAKGIDISAAIIKVVGLAAPNYLRLNAAEKVTAQEAFTPYRMNGLMPPIIGDPSEMALTLAIKIYLNTAFSGNAQNLVDATIAAYMNKLNTTLDLFEIENIISLQDFVRIARVSIQGTLWSTVTYLSRGKFVTPPTPNGFVYRLTTINHLTGSVEPTWPLTAGLTVQDGDNVWTAVANTNLAGIPDWTPATIRAIDAVVKPTVANGFTYTLTAQKNYSDATEPVWPFLVGAQVPADIAGQRVNDKQLIWVARPQVGTPATWSANTAYVVGDCVVAVNPLVPNTVGVMFQCIDFRGETGGSIPTFPVIVDHTVDDGSVTWTCVDPIAEKLVADIDQYLTISTAVSTT